MIASLLLFAALLPAELQLPPNYSEIWAGLILLVQFVVIGVVVAACVNICDPASPISQFIYPELRPVVDRDYNLPSSPSSHRPIYQRFTVQLLDQQVTQR